MDSKKAGVQRRANQETALKFSGRNGARESDDLIPAHAQRIRHAIDVVKPGRNQSDLQDGFVVKSVRSQSLVILLRDARRIARQLRDVIKHHLVLL
jgi:hypothetical protein